MNEIERFLEPIPGDNPVGKNLKYSLHDKIKEARRQEDSGPVGLWEREAKSADFKQVIKLSEEALLKSTKDLWVAAWLTEAWIYEYDVPGLTSGLSLLQGLIERFWDNLYPELDDGDAELRATPLEWVGSYFDPSKGSSPIFALRSVALTNSGFGWFVYQESRRIGYENEVSGNETRKKTREAAIKEGKLPPEEFDADFETTPKQFYKDLQRDFKAAREALEALDEKSRDKFADAAPSFTPLRKALEEVENVAHILLLKKLEKEPDLPEPDASTLDSTVPPDGTGQAAGSASLTAISQLDLSQLSGGAITSVDQAILHIVAAAQFLRQTNPGSPVSYLLLRALRWGEVRSAGESATADLPAPPAEVRTGLRASAAAKNWRRVLETAEGAMGTAVGRGWLDLQRYSIKACDELGYTAAATALRSELKAFLHDFPQLVASTLNDDTGTANPDTLAWLRQEGLAG
ncbi:MAG TPA: type VI secretion system protein TssA [Bryobacteraceae bacterium]|jgi:type VI secretion system protein ImpA